ncbi:YbhB/YbcL family Raf kinase inhibitor-like protein [Paraburkholderia pallida]|uniref:YbhB/YbcL family Raf kinase inhibitor-like protein n=1 Tax=Paraburkholderia pallida TaxID=2547399 RepID=A0A4P7CNB7_9BURK|nr:YbhB/YbcL family Raf kinase inhibitor-like protein [Paraburkholderia pallida]
MRVSHDLACQTTRSALPTVKGARAINARTIGRLATGLLLIALACADVHAQSTFALSSTNFRDGAQVAASQVFNESGCTGANRSPQLTWRNSPAGTRSYAVTMFDPDAPGSGWWHWAAANIPAHVNALPENASASGALKQLGALEALNDFGGAGYGGPCPPPGKPHRYVVTVYALGVDKLALAPGAPAAVFDHAIHGAALGSAQITVTYGR